MTNADVRAQCALSDSEVIATFRSLFSRTIAIERVVFTSDSLDLIDSRYQTPKSYVAARGTFQGLDVLTVGNAAALDGRLGSVLAVDFGAVRAWTFVP